MLYVQKVTVHENWCWLVVETPHQCKYKKVTIQQIWPMQLIGPCSELEPMMVGTPYKCLSAKSSPCSKFESCSKLPPSNKFKPYSISNEFSERWWETAPSMFKWKKFTMQEHEVNWSSCSKFDPCSKLVLAAYWHQWWWRSHVNV